MQLHSWLAAAIKNLKTADVPTARLDCLVLLADLSNQDQSWLLAHPEHELEPAQVKKLDQQINRRIKHEPLAYIRGRSEFYGRDFSVSAHTLEPRPETETMIDCLKKLWKPEFENFYLLDVGTGSGAIGITAALELKTDKIDLIDIDEDALKIAQKNVEHYSLALKCQKSDLLTEAEKSYDILLANLPYVPDSHTINAAAMQEPAHAIFGGPDGLDLYRRLFEQAAAQNRPPRLILTESLPFQHAELTNITNQRSYEQIKEDDFIQVFKKI